MSANLEHSAGTADWKSSIFILIPKKDNVKEFSDYHPTVLISLASKVMLKILSARPQQYMNWEIPDVQAGFRKGRETRDQIANICWIMEKAREFQKNVYYKWSLTWTNWARGGSWLPKELMTIGFWELAEIPGRTWTFHKEVALFFPSCDLKE